MLYDYNGQNYFFRWFYDSVANVERLDGIDFFNGELYFTETIINYSTEVVYTVIYHDETVLCFTNTTQGTIFNPSFKGFTYAGQSIVMYRQCNWFIFNNDNYMLQVYTDAKTNEFVRIDFTDASEDDDYTFTEMNVGDQDSNLFVLPAAIAAICPSP